MVAFAACSKGVTPPNIGALAGVGTSCAADKDCRTGLSCSTGTCQPKAVTSEGGACTLTGSCASGLYCSTQQVCANAGTAALGAACSSSGDCQRGLVCALSGIFALCQTAGAGDVGAVCTQTTDCLAGLGCQSGKCEAGMDPLAIVPFAPTCAAEAAPPFKAYFKVPEPGAPLGDFFDLPFPNEARVRANGKINMEGFPSPATGPGASLIGAYLASASSDTGGRFSLNPVVTFRFTAPVDLSSVSFSGSSKSLYFVQLTPSATSDDTSQGCNSSALPWQASGVPGIIDYTSSSAGYVCPNSLSVRPGTAYPLLPDTEYAVILTSDVKSTKGDSLQSDDDLQTVLGTVRPGSRPALQRAFDCYSGLRNAASGLPAFNKIAAATVFRTEAVPAAVQAISATVMAQTPQITALVKCGGGAVSPCHDGNDPSRDCPAAADPLYDEYHGQFAVPVLQKGIRPYLASEGNIVYATGGAVPAASDTVVTQGTEQVCFSLAVPKTAPVGIAIYGHGTGGNFRSAQSEAAGAGTLADLLIGKGLAVWTWDQPMHGPRRNSPTSPDMLYFNLGNPAAARDNALQAVADAMISVQTLQNIGGNIYKSGVDATELKTHFVASEPLVYLGHSQGAVNAVAFGAVDTGISAMALSGVGGGITQTLLNKKLPLDFSVLMAGVLGEASISEFDPVLGLIQMIVDRSDGINYGRYYRQFPSLAASATPRKSVFEIVGVSDSYVPLRTASDLWRTFDTNPLNDTEPSFEKDASVEPGPSFVAFEDSMGAARTAALPVFPSAGLSCNCNDVNGCLNSSPATARAYTIGLSLYAPPAGKDGHFVLFEDASAGAQVASFFANVAQDGGVCAAHLPTIPGP